MKPSEDKGSVLAESLRHEKVDERVNGSGGFREQRSNQTKLSRDLLEYCVFSREKESKTIAGDMIMIIIIIVIIIIILVIIITMPKPPYGRAKKQFKQVQGSKQWLQVVIGGYS